MVFPARISVHRGALIIGYTENYVRDGEESRSVFFLHVGSEPKHPGFGKLTVLATLLLTKNKPQIGRMDRRSIIYFILLLSGDIEVNLGPVVTRQAAARLRELQLFSETKNPSG